MYARRFGGLAVLLSLLAAPASAQGPLPVADAPSTRVWVRAESSVWAEPLWAGAGLGLTVERDRLVGEASYAFGEAFWGRTTANVLSVSGGFHGRVGRFDLAVLTGPAVSWGTNTRAYPADERYRALGGVAKAAAVFEVGPAVGIGVEGRAIVNSSVSSVGGGPVVRVKLAGGR